MGDALEARRGRRGGRAMRSSNAWRCRSTSAAVAVSVDAHRGQQLAACGRAARPAWRRRSRSRPRRGRARRPRTAAAPRVGGGGAPARGRSAGRAPRRCPRRRAARRGGGRGGAGSASTGRGRAPPWAGAAGSSRPPPSAGAAPESSSPSSQSRNTHCAGGARGRAAAARCSAWRVTTSAAASVVGSQLPLEPSVQIRWWTDGAGGRPLGQRGAAAELHVVGVGADGQRHGGRRQVQRHGTASAR